MKREIDLEAHELPLLQAFCESVDRAEEARRAVEQEGAYYSDFRGQPKPHPALREERESRLAASRLLRELRLADRKASESDDRFDARLRGEVPDWLRED
jgi:phage terminase small subunit